MLEVHFLKHPLQCIDSRHGLVLYSLESLLQKESDHAMFRSRRYQPQAKGVDLVTEQPSCQESASV